MLVYLETDALERKPVLYQLSKVEPEKIQWLWKSWLPLAKIALFDGDPGTGKSLLTHEITARVTTGRGMPDGSVGVEPSNVLIISSEDGRADTIRPRLDAAGADCERVFALSEIKNVDEENPLVIPGDLDLIEETIYRHSIRLVIIDPLMAFLSGTVNSHKDQDIRRVLHKLKIIAENTGACILIVRHLNKSSGGNALYRGGGSIGIIGAARVAAVVAKDPNDDSKRVLAINKINVEESPESLLFSLVKKDGSVCIEWGGVSGCSASDLLSVNYDSEEGNAINEAKEFLGEVLADGAVSAVSLLKQAKKAGLSERTLKRAKAAMNIGSQKEGFGSGWSWSLPNSSSSEPLAPLPPSQEIHINSTVLPVQNEHTQGGQEGGHIKTNNAQVGTEEGNAAKQKRPKEPF